MKIYAYSKSRQFNVHVMAITERYAMVRRADDLHAAPFVLDLRDLSADWLGDTRPTSPSPQEGEKHGA
jgi:hypothetical protein